MWIALRGSFVVMASNYSSVVLALPPNTRASCMNDWVMRLYVAYVYRVLLREKISVDFQDHLGNKRGFEKSLALCLSQRRRGRRLYGVAMFVGNKTGALWLLRKIRAKDPDGLVVAFGPFAAIFYRNILEAGLADVVVQSDAEFIFPKLWSAGNRLAGVPNLAYWRGKEMVLSGRATFDDLDSLPFAGQYFVDKEAEEIPVVAARGCAFRCSFCDRPMLWGTKVRMRSVENVVSEIDFLVRRYHVRNFVFADANFILTKERTDRLCRKLLQLPSKISWWCSARVDCVNPKTLLLMRKAGCQRIYFGVESGDAQTLRTMGKRYGRKEIVQSARWAREAGLTVGIFLIVGTPGESMRSLRMTKRLLVDLHPFSELTVNPLVILPGTPLYADLAREGKISEDEYFEKDALMLFDHQDKLYQKDFPSLGKFFEEKALLSRSGNRF